MACTVIGTQLTLMVVVRWWYGGVTVITPKLIIFL